MNKNNVELGESRKETPTVRDWLDAHGRSRSHDRWYGDPNFTLVLAIALQKVLGGEVCVVQEMEGPEKDPWYEWPWVNKCGLLRLGVLYLGNYGAQSLGEINGGEPGMRVVNLAETWTDVDLPQWSKPPDLGGLVSDDRLSCELASALRRDFNARPSC